MGYVQTVLGPVRPGALGVTHTHEHILSDLSHIGQPPEDPFAREVYYAPIRMDILGYISNYNFANLDNLRLDDEETATNEIALYKQHGGGAIVEASSIGLSRNPDGLARISRATGVHLIMGSSYYVKEAHPPNMDDLTEDEIYEEIVRDVTTGVGTSGIRSGIIGEVGCSYPLSDNERKVLRASARAQRATGAPLLIHPGRDEPSPEEIIGVIVEAGGDPSRAIIGHLERTVMDRRVLLRIAEAGCYLEWDHFGLGLPYYPPNPKITMLNDAGRADVIAHMIGHGYGDKILTGHDVAQKAQMDRLRRSRLLLHPQAGRSLAQDSRVHRRRPRAFASPQPGENTHVRRAVRLRTSASADEFRRRAGVAAQRYSLLVIVL